MFEPKIKTINGIKFKVVPFPSIVALRLKVHLIKLFGPAFGQIMGSVQGIGKGKTSLMDAKIDGSGIAGALETLFAQLTEDEFIDTLTKLLSNTSCEISGKSNNKSAFISFNEDFATKMDMVFQGKLFTIYPLILFILEVNFPDFFGQMEGIGDRFATFMSKLGSNEEEIQTTKSETSEN